VQVYFARINNRRVNQMPKVSEAIGSFLHARATPANQDLVDRWNIGMEVQVNVSAGNGELVAGKKGTYSDGVNEWHSIRIPKKAMSDPEFTDYELRWPLDLHAEGIGMTGWDWQERKSRWVAFDVDSIIGHAAGVGISDENLEKVKQVAGSLPYVEVRKSTGGGGLHLYVYLDGIPTANHTEHAALARAILGMLSSETGFDFSSQIDACGQIMWVWHKKMTAGNSGLSVIKPAEKILTINDLPSNWRDHIEVVTRRRAKLKVSGVSEDGPFEALSSGRRMVPLDAKHKEVIDELTRSGFSTVWIPDYHLLQTHTKALEGLKESLKIKGIFKTNSPGRHPETCNCFCFPLDEGAWRVYRFSPGTTEAETWQQDGNGWTTCYFNRTPDLDTVARVTGGVEAPDNGGYVFSTAEDAAKAIELLGQPVEIPAELKGRVTNLKVQKDGRISINVKKEKGEAAAPQGWVNGRGKIQKLLNLRAEVKAQIADESYGTHDKIIRTLITPLNKAAGWVLNTEAGDWSDRPKDDIRSALVSQGMSKTDAEVVLGGACLNPWRLVVQPFQPEYPGGRQWNREAAQFRYQPSEGEHPHWDMILQHCFGDLDNGVRNHPWCQKHNVKSGAEYGLLWVANLFRFPFKPLPYLFLYGGENCGKSTLHESLQFLMTKGITCANNSLTNQSNFNGELAGAILAYVAELDISKYPGALNKIKEWVVSPMLPIRQMRTDTYMMPNTLHFIQTANSADFCPIFPGDTRITMICVSPLGDKEIGRDKFHEFLTAEAPHYLYTLLNIPLPEPEGRLRIPVIDTGNKARVQDNRRPLLEQFIAEHCHAIPGGKVRFKDLYENFIEWIGHEERTKWTKRRVLQELKLPHGVHAENMKWVGNISWDDSPVEDSRPWVAENGRLRQ
jgi:hypothetical protein